MKRAGAPEAVKLDAVRLRYNILAIFLLILAGYNFATYTVTSAQQSTFNLQPGLIYPLSVIIHPPESINGRFQETSGNPVSFYILSSAQYAAYQRGESFDYGYSITNTPSSDITYSFPVQDTYYLTFRHGPSLVNSTETINFQRTYTTYDSFRLTLGLVFLSIGALNLVYNIYRRGHKPARAPVLESGQNAGPTS